MRSVALFIISSSHCSNTWTINMKNHFAKIALFLLRNTRKNRHWKNPKSDSSCTCKECVSVVLLLLCCWWCCTDEMCAVNDSLKKMLLEDPTMSSLYCVPGYSSSLLDVWYPLFGYNIAIEFETDRYLASRFESRDIFSLFMCVYV